MKILYVENHPVFINAVKREFLKDYDVVDVAKIASAKETFADEAFDLILCDYDLDDGKGADFVSFVRASDAVIPIIAASAHDRGNNNLMAAGATAICGKMDFKNLPKLLETLINT